MPISTNESGNIITGSRSHRNNTRAAITFAVVGIDVTSRNDPN